MRRENTHVAVALLKENAMRRENTHVAVALHNAWQTHVVVFKHDMADALLHENTMRQPHCCIFK